MKYRLRMHNSDEPVGAFRRDLLDLEGTRDTLAISGQTHAERHFSSLHAISKKIRAMGRKKIVAWVIGPGGYTSTLTPPDESGMQRVSIMPYRRARPPTEHAEVKEMLVRSRLKHELWVMDILPDNVELAKKSLPESDAVRYVQGNIAQAHPAAQPDVICCHNVLNYLGKELALQTLAELAEALRPGGVLSIDKNSLKHLGGKHEVRSALGGRAVIEEPSEAMLIVRKGK